jgi:uncharacterized damage-inducible protein DinB
MLRDLFAHAEWADATVWRASMTTDDPVIREKLHHIHATQHGFLSMWLGAPAMPPPLSAFADLPAIARFGHDFHEAVPAFLGTLTDDALDRELVLPWATMIEASIGRPPAPSTLREALLQITSHSTYHRGQVNMRLRELGNTPPLVDYIAWIWMRRPPAEWP